MSIPSGPKLQAGLDPLHRNEQLVETLISSDITGRPEIPSVEDANSGDNARTNSQKPWWKRPSPWWLLAAMPFNAIASSSKLAPRIEIYTHLACTEHTSNILRPSPRGEHAQAINDANSVLDVEISPEIPMAYVYFPESLFLSGNENIKPESTTPNRNVCAGDPVVQAAVAKLIAVITTCSGILSLLTTGWWSAYSDRHGRPRVLFISGLGLLLNDINFVFVTKFHPYLLGGYWFFVLGSVFEGILGGFTTSVAINHTYLTDTAGPHKRSRILSINLGFLFTGMAIGPMFGSLLIRATGRTLSVFYTAIFIELLFVLLTCFILPESTTKEQMVESRAKYHADLAENTTEHQSNSAVGLLWWMKRTLTFLSPLAILTPSVRRNSVRRDWTLARVAVAYGITISVLGSMQFKLQFAASEFGWTSEQLGYWVSLLSASRAIVMGAILPVAIKILKSKPVAEGNVAQPTVTETSPLLETTGENHPSYPIRRDESLSFDLKLAQVSLLIDVVSYSFMAIAQSAYQFTISAIMGSFGLGFTPAMQSVSLALYTWQGGTESGRLFGALSVVQALSSEIFGPSLYGFVYARTVATFPRAIFYVTAVTLIISSAILLLVRLPMDGLLEIDPEESPLMEEDL